MIKLGNKDITLKLGSTNISAAYLGSIQVYGGGHSYDLCYGVTDDISTYTGTFKDVFDKSSDTWYKLNNLNEYEEYGVYGSGRTSCEGSTSRLPQGYTEVEYIRQNSNYDAYINTGVFLFDNKTNSYIVTTKLASEFHSNLSCATIISAEVPQSPYNGMGYRYKCSTTVNELEFFGGNSNYSASSVDNGDGTRTITFQSTGDTTWTSSVPLSLLCSFSDTSFTIPFRYADVTIYSSIIVKNGVTVRNYVPAKRDSDSKYGLYDLVTNTFYTSPNGNNFIGGNPVTPTECVTTYEGKLTIDGDYEYQYTNGAWVNVGEVTGTTATLPDVPFTVNINAKNYDSTTKKFAKTTGQLVDTDITITQGTVTPHDGYVTVTGNTRCRITGYQQYFNRDSNNPNFTIISKHRTADNTNVHLFANRDGNYNWMYRPASNQLKFHGSSQINGVSVTTQPVIGGVRVDSSNNLIFNNYTDNTTTTPINFSYGSTNSGGVALFAGYASPSSGEWFQGDFYWIYISQNTLTDAQVQQVIDFNEDGGSSEYPIYYDEKADPLDNLTFNSLAEAETYAYTHCVYDGMKATIDGEKYAFDSTNGWTLIPEYYKVEDITPGSASGWTITGSSTYNPDSSYYDDFSVENTTTTNVTKIAKVTIYGYDHFTYYLRSRFYTYNYGYAYATNIDELSSDPTTDFGYNSSSAITNTYDFQKDPASIVNLFNYRRVTYNNLDKTVEHTFYVVFYGRRRSGSQANATILIPKDQTNENWEQVEFSASTNVATNNPKNLYIDGNNSTSGGTNRFYHRWIIGLPAGTHTGYTNYSNYNYCPSVSSATFTSVAGNSRQVNFVYDAIQTKSLQFNLVDSSGNTLTPSNDVYYYIQEENSCGAAQRINIRMPNSAVPLPVGGRFNLQNNGNLYHIYGYTPTQDVWNYHYTDNYTTNFDIVYTKLSEEAVTLSYVTYDPNDSETPSFMTEVTYPYNGGTTSATTLTSFNVPYTYPYTVVQTNDLFSADTYTYTAGQASRTITFTLYPNNREFQTVADLEAYQYAWEGMKAYVGSTNYKYENGQWVEIIYNEYEYIKTVGTAATRYTFNTGFYPTTAHTIELKIQLTDNSVDWGRIFGWSSCDGDSCDSTQYRFTTVTSWGLIARRGNTAGTSYKAVNKNIDVTCTIPISSTTNWYYTTGTSSTVNSATVNSGTFSSPSTTPLHLLGLGYQNDNRGSAHLKYYYLKVYDQNHNLVKHYVASDYNGTPCFYEKVDGEFVLDTYTGSNHGTCSLGNPVTPQTPQWVTFNSGDDISGLNVYGVKGVAINLSNTFASVSENICFELDRNIVNAIIGDYSNPCYTDTYGINDNVELIFGNIGCSDYYTLPASKTATRTFQLYIYQ